MDSRYCRASEVGFVKSSSAQAGLSRMRIDPVLVADQFGHGLGVNLD
jgi:hypothetical protein